MTTTVLVSKEVTLGYVNGEGWGYKRNLKVSASIRVNQRSGSFQTIDHGTVTDCLVLAVSFGVWNTRLTDYVSCGQIDDLGSFVKYAPGWDSDKVTDLRNMWSRWHLNDMRAGCSHQDRNAGLGSPACPETGYKYGHAWLVESLPLCVLFRVATMV
jgi:hypothetical protein